jgi:hypothetical protein
MSTTATRERAETADEVIRPFQVSFPGEAIEDLKGRIANTRWPERETVEDDSHGVRQALIQDLARHRATGYDFGRWEQPKLFADELRSSFRSLR